LKQETKLNLVQHLTINKKSPVPKYEQIVKTICSNIKANHFKQGSQLPSINQLTHLLGVSRDTVIRAFRELVSMGILTGIPGKGYYVSRGDHKTKHNILLLFDHFLPYKRMIYTSFIESFDDDAIIDIYFHHDNVELFKKLINESVGKYTDYVIMPIERVDSQFKWLDNIMKNQNIYILDIGYEEYGKHYPCVCQDFIKQWYDALSSIEDSLKKYKQIIFIWNQAIKTDFTVHHEHQMRDGMIYFCKDKKLHSEVLTSTRNLVIKKGVCYLIPNDDDLVEIIEKAKKTNLTIGKDIGIISHNDLPIKKIIGQNGITTISTDFTAMGKTMAEMVIKGEKRHIINPSHLIERGSV